MASFVWAKRAVQLLSLGGVGLVVVAMMPSAQTANAVSDVPASEPRTLQVQTPLPAKAEVRADPAPLRVGLAVPVKVTTEAAVVTPAPVDGTWLQWIKPTVAASAEDIAARARLGVTEPLEAKAPTEQAKVGRSALNVRAGPSTETARLFVLSPNEQVTVVEKDGDWAMVRNAGGESGWVASKYLVGGSFGTPEPVKAARTEEPRKRAAAEPRTASVETEVPEKRRSRFEAGTVSLGSDVTLRSRPSRMGQRVITLPAGERVGIVEQRGGWIRVVTQTGETGWVRVRR